MARHHGNCPFYTAHTRRHPMDRRQSSGSLFSRLHPSGRTTLRRSTTALVAVLAGTTINHAHAICTPGSCTTPETGITIEAVDKYSCGRLANNIANVDNFRNRMLSISGYTAGARFTDPWVYPTDFTDPERVSGGEDTYNFDRPGDVIAYFSGHG